MGLARADRPGVEAYLVDVVGEWESQSISGASSTSFFFVETVELIWVSGKGSIK